MLLRLAVRPSSEAMSQGPRRVEGVAAYRDNVCEGIAFEARDDRASLPRSSLILWNPSLRYSSI